MIPLELILSVEDRSIYTYICIPLQTKPRNPFSILKPFKQTQSNLLPTVFSQEENRGQNFRCRSHSSNAETEAKERASFLAIQVLLCQIISQSASTGKQQDPQCTHLRICQETVDQPNKLYYACSNFCRMDTAGILKSTRILSQLPKRDEKG